MPILLGAIAYKSDLPKYDELLNEWLDKSLKPEPPRVKCPKCDVEYILIEPDVEPEDTVKSDIAVLKTKLEQTHPIHPPYVAFRADTDPNLAEQVRRICDLPQNESRRSAPKDVGSPGVPQIIQQPTEEIKYPSWQPQCCAVMIEIDPVKMKEMLAIAEAAMTERSAQLTTPEDDVERRAMKAEGDAMRLALATVLSHHPDLEAGSKR